MSSRCLVGLTGNIATGKSTVRRILAALGATSIDADRVAHHVLRAGSPAFSAVIQAFGEEIVGADGEIDRARLGSIVFADPAALARLEAIVHPTVIAETLQQIAAAPTPVVVVEAIKLIESGMHTECDSVWVTTCPVEAQIQRLMADRTLTRAEAELRVKAQPPQAEKLALADVVIDTSGTLEETEAQVRAAWKQLTGTTPEQAGSVR